MSINDPVSEIGAALADEFFSLQEKEKLDKIETIRFGLIDKLIMKDGQITVPGSTSEKVLLADLLNNSGKAITDRAKLRIASKATDAAMINSNEIAAVLRKHHVATQRPASVEERALPAEIKPAEVVPGEMNIGIENISIHEIIRE